MVAVPRRRPVLVIVTALLLTSSSAPGGQNPRHLLTSVDQNIDIGDWQITARDAGIASQVPWSVRKQRLHGGRQDGVDLVHIDNGRLTLTLVPTRGMGVLRVVMGDLRLGWDSPVREVVHPKYVNLTARGGLGWLEGFNEWLARCGLEWAGHPGRDMFVNNLGEQAEMDLTLHGKIANIPASEVEVIIDRDPRPRIRVRGRVDERAFYGPKLELWTEVSTEPGGTTFRIEDTLANRGAYDQEFQVIYHANYGPPLLGAGSRFVAPLRQVTPFNAHAAKDVSAYNEYGAPTVGFVEQVYNLRPSADGDGRSLVMLRNAAGDRGVSMGFAVDRASLLHTVEEPDSARGGLRDRARARHRVSLYPEDRARGRTRAEAEARRSPPLFNRRRPPHDRCRRRASRRADYARSRTVAPCRLIECPSAEPNRI